MNGARMGGTRRFLCEMTLMGGKIVYDLNGLAKPDWTTLPKNYRSTADPRWDAVGRRRP
jgi:dihydroorotase